MQKTKIAASIILIFITVISIFPLTVEAKTKAKSKTVKTVTLTFNANGGKISNKNSKKEKSPRGKAIKMPTKKPVRKNYDFKGWYTRKTKGKKITKKSKTPLKARTYYARWAKQPKSVSITFNANKGNFSGKDFQIKRNVLNRPMVFPASNPTRKNYIFRGWYTQKTEGKKITENTKVPASNTIYYARWVKIEKLEGIYSINGKRIGYFEFKGINVYLYPNEGDKPLEYTYELYGRTLTLISKDGESEFRISTDRKSFTDKYGHTKYTKE